MKIFIRRTNGNGMMKKVSTKLNFQVTNEKLLKLIQTSLHAALQETDVTGYCYL